MGAYYSVHLMHVYVDTNVALAHLLNCLCYIHQTGKHCNMYMYMHLQGYIIPLESRLGSWKLNKEDIDNVFGNVREIKDFNR